MRICPILSVSLCLKYTHTTAWWKADTEALKLPYFLIYFPPLNSFLTPVRKLFKFLLHKGKLNAETIWNFQGFTVPKKNSCRGNYMRKYGCLSKKMIPLTEGQKYQTQISSFVSYQKFTINLNSTSKHILPCLRQWKFWSDSFKEAYF